MSSHVQELTDQVTLARKDLESCREGLAVKGERLHVLETQCSRQAQELVGLRAQLQEEDYRITNFDSVKRECDGLKRDLGSLQKANGGLEHALRATSEEKEQQRQELSSALHSLSLVNQDKEYLSKQVAGLTGRLALAREGEASLAQQLEALRLAKDEMQGQFVKASDEQKQRHEQSLSEEVEALKLRSKLEADQLMAETRETFQREKRSLEEALHNATAERDRALAELNGANRKHDQLQLEHSELQSSTSGRLSGLQAELQALQVTHQRALVDGREAARDLKQKVLENEKLQKKVEVLTREVWSVGNEARLRALGLEAQLQERDKRLQVYESLEKELDDVVMQAAEVDGDSDAERVLFSYGFGANMPSTSRRRMQQSVQLARRVLKLEKINSSLRKDLNASQAKELECKKELSEAKSLLDASHQPHAYLIECVRKREEELKAANGRVSLLEQEVRSLSEERVKLVDTRNDMAQDLERLLRHREELGLMRQTVLGLQGRQQRWHSDPSGADLPCRSSGSSDEASKLKDAQLPTPTVFTKQGPPSWYKKLKQRNSQFNNT